MFMSKAHAILSIVAATVAAVPVARGQRVALVDEQVIREQPTTGSDVPVKSTPEAFGPRFTWRVVGFRMVNPLRLGVTV